MATPGGHGEQEEPRQSVDLGVLTQPARSFVVLDFRRDIFPLPGEKKRRRNRGGGFFSGAMNPKGSTKIRGISRD